MGEIARQLRAGTSPIPDAASARTATSSPWTPPGHLTSDNSGEGRQPLPITTAERSGDRIAYPMRIGSVSSGFVLASLPADDVFNFSAVARMPATTSWIPHPGLVFAAPNPPLEPNRAASRDRLRFLPTAAGSGTSEIPIRRDLPGANKCWTSSLNADLATDTSRTGVIEGTSWSGSAKVTPSIAAPVIGLPSMLVRMRLSEREVELSRTTRSRRPRSVRQRAVARRLGARLDAATGDPPQPGTQPVSVCKLVPSSAAGPGSHWNWQPFGATTCTVCASTGTRCVIDPALRL